MKSILSNLFLSITFVIIVATFFAFAVPNSAFASNNNNFSNFTNFFHFNRNHGDNNNDHNDNKDKDCRKHPEIRECHVSVPEFGFIPGAIALLSSGGTFLFLKKRKSKI